MSNDVRTTTTTALSNQGLSSYGRQAEPIISILEEREFGIADALIEFGVGAGMPETQVRDALVEAGLGVRPEPEPEPVASNGNSGDSDLLRRVERLEQVARSRGLL
jgi:hypothetical protein